MGWLKKVFGGGGGILGTVLGITSAFIPALQPVAIAYNSVKAIQSGNPLNIAMAGFGAYNAFSGAGGLGGGGYSPDNIGSYGNFTGPMPESAFNFSSPSGLEMSVGSGWNTDPITGAESWGGSPVANGALTTGLDGSTQLPDWAKSANFNNMPGFNPTGEVGSTITGLNKSLGDIGSSSNFGDFANSTGLKGNSTLGLGGMQSGDTFNVSSPTTDTASIGSTINESIAPDNFGQTAQNTPSSLDGLNSGQGIKADGGIQGLQPQSYTYENKDFLTGRNGTGMNADVSELAPNFKQGLEMNNLPDIWNKLNTPVGSTQGVQATPLGMGARGLAALYDMRQQGKAQDFLKSQINQSNQWSDQNAQRNQFAGNEWMKSQSDPMYGYDTFMRGAGGDFLAQARARAAQTGNRGSYLDSGRMNTDLANLWLKNQGQRSQSLAGGFSQGNPYQGGNQLTAGYADMMRNKAAPLGQFANYASNFDLSKLWS